MRKLEIYGLRLPEIRDGDDLVGLIIEAADREGVYLCERDILVITSKVLSKALGLYVDIRGIKPSRAAARIAGRSSSDPRFIELLLRESDALLLAIPFKKLVERRVIRLENISREFDAALKALEYYPTVFITLRDGMLWSESGIDTSNHPEGIYSMPPRDLDGLAREISNAIYERVGARTAVVIADTELLPWGAMDIARGSYGIKPVKGEFGEPDMYGKAKFGGVDNIAFSLCSAAALLMGQRDEGIPVVIIRGLEYEWFNGGLRGLLPSVESLREALGNSIKHTVRILGRFHIFKLLISILRE